MLLFLLFYVFDLEIDMFTTNSCKHLLFTTNSCKHILLLKRHSVCIGESKVTMNLISVIILIIHFLKCVLKDNTFFCVF